MGKKYYAVIRGHTPGIYTDHETANKQITGYSNSKMKVFKNLNAAEQYMKNYQQQSTNNPKNTSLSEKKLEVIEMTINAIYDLLSKHFNSINKTLPEFQNRINVTDNVTGNDIHYWTDGSYKPQNGIAGYGFCLVENNILTKLYSNQLIDYTEKENACTNEYAAICAAVIHARTHGFKNITIHTDSLSFIQAVTNNKTDNYMLFLQFFVKQGMTIAVTYTKAHADDAYNSLAHFLSRKGADICEEKALKHIRKLEKLISDNDSVKNTKKIRKHLKALNALDRKN